MSSGIPMRDGTGHVAVPVPGSYVREADGRPVDLLEALSRPGDWPLAAACRPCEGRIALHDPRGHWVHVPGTAPAAGR